jgi:hypothetical protein
MFTEMRLPRVAFAGVDYAIAIANLRQLGRRAELGALDHPGFLFMRAGRDSEQV